MTADDGGRPQDQARKHRRGGEPSPETSTLLARYQTAMRDELSALLDDIAGRVPDPGLLDEPGQPLAPVRLGLKERAPVWDLAIKLARELGTEVDPARGVGADPSPAAPAARRRRRVDFG